MRQHTVDGILITNPTREDVEGLREGDLAPNCWGRMATITRIFARGKDRSGLAYVCYYTENGPGSEISGSLKEGETVGTIPLTMKYSRSELAPLPAA
jgi:hypothetical protein